MLFGLFDRQLVPLGLVVVVGLAGALWIKRRRDERDELSCLELEQQTELLEIWLLICAMVAIGAATWAAAQHRFPSGLG